LKNTPSVTVSFGVAITNARAADDAGHDPNWPIRSLYQAKNNRRNRVVAA